MEGTTTGACVITSYTCFDANGNSGVCPRALTVSVSPYTQTCIGTTSPANITPVSVQSSNDLTGSEITLMAMIIIGLLGVMVFKSLFGEFIPHKYE